MALAAAALLLLLSWGVRASGGPAADRPPRRSGADARQHPVYPPRDAAETHASLQLFRGRHGDAEGGGARLRAHEVPPAACTDAECASPKPSNDTRECGGIECRLPPRMRARHRGGAELSASSSPRPPAHLADRAAQFLGDFPDLEYPPPELGAAPLGVQLTCDIKPGEFNLLLLWFQAWTRRSKTRGTGIKPGKCSSL